MQFFRTCFSKLRFQLTPCKPQKILHSPETAEISAEKPSHNYYRRNRRQQHPYRIPDPFPRNRPLINCGNNRPNRRKLRLKQAREQQERKNLNRCFRPVSFILFFQNLFSFLFHFSVVIQCRIVRTITIPSAAEESLLWSFHSSPVLSQRPL